jgi:hypothetical protein
MMKLFDTACRKMLGVAVLAGFPASRENAAVAAKERAAATAAVVAATVAADAVEAKIAADIWGAKYAIATATAMTATAFTTLPISPRSVRLLAPEVPYDSTRDRIAG